MKNIIQLSIVLLSSLVLFSCNKDIEPQLLDITNTSLKLFAIELVDDELGYAYGYIQEVENSKITTFKIVAPYETITYDSIANLHYVDMSQIEDNANEDITIERVSYKLAGL